MLLTLLLDLVRRPLGLFAHWHGVQLPVHLRHLHPLARNVHRDEALLSVQVNLLDALQVLVDLDLDHACGAACTRQHATSAGAPVCMHACARARAR